MNDLHYGCHAETPEEARERHAREEKEDADALVLIRSALSAMNAFLFSMKPGICAQFETYGSVWTFWVDAATGGPMLYWAAGSHENPFEEVYTAADSEKELGWSDATHAASCINRWLSDTNRRFAEYKHSVLDLASRSATYSNT